MLVFATAVISGFSIFINKYGVATVNPYVFVFLKNSAVAIALISLVILVKDFRGLAFLNKKQWLQLIFIGLVGGSLPFLLFFKGLTMTSAAQGSFVHKSLFLFASLLALIFLKEKINFKFLLGAALIFAGNLILIKSFTSFNRGDLLIFLAVLFWAVESILAKHILKNVSGTIVAGGRMFFGSIFILLFLAASGQTDSILQLSSDQTVWILVTAALLFGYTVSWYNGLKFLPVSVASAILLLGSPITTFLSLVAGGKIISRDLFSGFLITSGVFILVGADYILKKARGLSVKNYVRS